MKVFEKRYGIKEDETVKSFHKSRRMFCIHKDKLFIAKPNLSYSHAVWFEKEGWMSKEKDELMNEIVRGIVNNEGNVYFYTGYDFQINKEIEFIFFNHLNELVKQLQLKSTAKIFGVWPPRKKYGQIKDNLSLG